MHTLPVWHDAGEMCIATCHIPFTVMLKNILSVKIQRENDHQIIQIMHSIKVLKLYCYL